jgi:hypothetical protein
VIVLQALGALGGCAFLLWLLWRTLEPLYVGVVGRAIAKSGLCLLCRKQKATIEWEAQQGTPFPLRCCDECHRKNVPAGPFEDWGFAHGKFKRL